MERNFLSIDLAAWNNMMNGDDKCHQFLQHLLAMNVPVVAVAEHRETIDLVCEIGNTMITFPQYYTEIVIVDEISRDNWIVTLLWAMELNMNRHHVGVKGLPPRRVVWADPTKHFSPVLNQFTKIKPYLSDVQTVLKNNISFVVLSLSQDRFEIQSLPQTYALLMYYLHDYMHDGKLKLSPCYLRPQQALLESVGTVSEIE